MNFIKTARTIAAAFWAVIIFAGPVQAAVTMSWSAGTTCGNAPAVGFSPGGATFQASLCVSTTLATERGCGFSAFLVSANAAENNAFRVVNSILGANYPDATANPVLPFLIANASPLPATDFGGTRFGSSSPPAVNQLLATFTFQAQASATNASYIIGFVAPSEFSIDLQSPPGPACGNATNSQAALPSLTLNLVNTPIITSVATTTFTVATAGTFTVTATGTPPLTFTATGGLPTGVSLTSAGLLSGTPQSATAGTYPLTVTASNGSLPNGTQNFSLVVAKRAQTIAFGAITGQSLNSPPLTITGASASSSLPLTFTSATTAVCTVSGATIFFVKLGNCTIAANQGGNVDFVAAAPVAQSFTVSASVPGAPIIGAVTGGNQTAMIAFTPPASDGGSAIVDYTATCIGGAGSASTGTAPPITVNGLTNGVTYSCSVRARNAVGTGAPSATATVTPVPILPPGAPAIGSVSPGNALAIIAFVAPANNGGSAITGFTTTCNPGAISVNTAGSPVIVVGLINSTTYNCSVTATNIAGTGLPSAAVTVTPINATITLSSTTSVAAYGAPVTLLASVAGNSQTGTVAFNVGTGNGPVVLPGCNAVPLVNGLASCTAPGTYQNQNPRQYGAAYSGDSSNGPASASMSQIVATNTAVLSVAANPLPPIVSGRTTVLTALIKMSSPAGTVTFFDNGVPVTGCVQTPLSMLPDATDSAVVNCTVVAGSSSSGIRQYAATYFYPAGHISGKVVETATIDVRVIAQGPLDYTDMWWVGAAENGWGISVTQHGSIQFNVIFAYDALGKSLWYVMPGGSFNAAGTVFTGSLYLPASSPFSAYDKSKFVIGAAVGTATITYTSTSTATLAYTINGISATKSIQRQVFSAETAGPNMRTNDLWWATFAEDGWGMNIAQQGRVLFPVWYTYDASGKATFFTAQRGSWSGTVWYGIIYAHSSSAWLGVPYNPAPFTATQVGTMTLDFSDASNATMTYTVNGITQVKSIQRQPY